MRRPYIPRVLLQTICSPPYTRRVANHTPLTEGVENGFWRLGKVVVVVVLSVVVLIITSEGEDDLGAQGWVGANIVGAEFTAVAKGGKVASKSVDEGLLS